jgi:hypothetical protein
MPAALSGSAVPSLQMERDAGWLGLRSQQRDFGTVDVVTQTRDAGVYRISLAPGASIRTRLHRAADESEMVLTAGLLCQGESVPAGAVNRWPPLSPHGYHNPTDRYQTILRVTCPPCADEDEIAVREGSL